MAQKRSCNNGKGKRKVVREQPRKDSRQKRVNFDNTREDKIQDISETKGSNDVTWYAHNPELLRSAASLPFSVTSGQKLAFWLDRPGTPTADSYYVNSVPGVLEMDWVPQIGGEFTDAVNQAKNSIYSFTVHANSRNTTYNATDEMIVILCGASLFSMIAMGIRAYGIMRNFDQRNEYTPEALIRATGFDYQDLKANLSHMWFDLNELVARSSQIWVPDDLPFIDRWFWMNTNIYMDGDSAKSQFYVFKPAYCLVYNETFNDEGGAAVYEPVGYSLTWQQYMAILNKQFNALLNSEDRGIIFGDILKAYGAEHIYALKPIPVDYRLMPVYDREVLTQIENASVIESHPHAIAQSQTTLDLYTDWNWAAPSTAKAIEAEHLIPERQVLNFHQVESPTPEQIMVATRLKAMGTSPIIETEGATKGVVGTYPTVCGTETIQRVKAWVYAQYNGVQTLVGYTINANFYSSNPRSSQMWYLMNAFDWCPWTYVLDSQNQNKYLTTDGTWYDTVVQFAIGDWDQYTTVDVETIRKMHVTAVYSEFGVPTL